VVKTVCSLESMGLALFNNIYNTKRVLVTGHTGFKGSWLTLWLSELGAEVAGISLAPEIVPSHWGLLGLGATDYRVDIRNYSAVESALKQFQPEIVFHLAAQPLVLRSYKDPIETWSTNVMGTANILEVCRHTSSVKAVVQITTDKCYENFELSRGYHEEDRLGGHDPYSASKAASELIAASYRKAFFDQDAQVLLATARAGNVIGGGDWSENRLIPDLVRATAQGISLEIRSPSSTRPWQHVLESLSGYLLLGQKLLLGQQEVAGPWNFGPKPEGNKSVSEVLTMIQKYWKGVRWHEVGGCQLHEAGLLYLNSNKAFSKLNWKPVWSFEKTIEHTVVWYKNWLETGEVVSKQQLNTYLLHARQAGLEWAVC
jgi:CDP-glucose 4,6-dehydratase